MHVYLGRVCTFIIRELIFTVIFCLDFDCSIACFFNLIYIDSKWLSGSEYAYVPAKCTVHNLHITIISHYMSFFRLSHRIEKRACYYYQLSALTCSRLIDFCFLSGSKAKKRRFILTSQIATMSHKTKLLDELEEMVIRSSRSCEPLSSKCLLKCCRDKKKRLPLLRPQRKSFKKSTTAKLTTFNWSSSTNPTQSLALWPVSPSSFTWHLAGDIFGLKCCLVSPSALLSSLFTAQAFPNVNGTRHLNLFEYSLGRALRALPSETDHGLYGQSFYFRWGLCLTKPVWQNSAPPCFASLLRQLLPPSRKFP